MSRPDEEAWLRAREAGEPLPPLDAGRAARYARLEGLLGALPELEPPAGWEERARAALAPLTEAPPVEASPPRRWPLALAAGLVAVAVGGGLLLRSRAVVEPAEPRLSIDVQRSAVARRGTDAAVGDTLRLRLTLPGPGELRLYRAEGPLVARCPGDPGCAEVAPGGAGRVVTLALPMSEPGTYRVVGFTGALALPTGQGLAADLEAADRAGTALVTAPPVVVR